MAYLDSTALKVYLDIPSGTTTDDTLLTALIASAQAAIDAHCRQTFEAAADTTRYFDPTRDVVGPHLYLDAPLCAITTITNGDGDAVAADKYVKEPRNSTPWHKLTLKSNAGIAWTYSGAPENAIVIVGKWAYSTTAPADIVQATRRLAAWLYRQRDNAFDLDRVVITGDTTFVPARIPADVVEMLKPYRRLV
jgi:hypothetical protein